MPAATASSQLFEPKRRRQLCWRLLFWFRRQARDLPWRQTRDPYAIWVSEIMLQQTQVSSVVPYFHRFLQVFPDVQALARADEIFLSSTMQEIVPVVQLDGRRGRGARRGGGARVQGAVAGHHPAGQLGADRLTCRRNPAVTRQPAQGQ